VATAADLYLQRRVVAVLWRQGNHMTLTYDDGTTSLVVAVSSVAERIAKDAGLVQGSTSDAEICWDQPGP
jgi:hypothetical protein